MELKRDYLRKKHPVRTREYDAQKRYNTTLNGTYGHPRLYYTVIINNIHTANNIGIVSNYCKNV